MLTILVLAAFYDGLVVKKYTITSEKITENHTFLLISDLHCTYYGKGQEELIERIHQYAPEAIFLTGDIAEDVRPIDGCAALITAIAPLYPCYYVTGNHERWSAAADDIKAVFREWGVTVLDGTYTDVLFRRDTIRLHGVDDPLYYESRAEYETVVGTLPVSDEYFDILLAHRPEYAPWYAQCGFELSLSGHAHGGQVRIPLLLNGLYAPNQGWFPRYAGGFYEINGACQIVSRGLMLDDLPRIFNPPELVVIRLEPEEDGSKWRYDQ